jgi:hypothetical protein
MFQAPNQSVSLALNSKKRERQAGEGQGVAADVDHLVTPPWRGEGWGSALGGGGVMKVWWGWQVCPHCMRRDILRP